MQNFSKLAPQWWDIDGPMRALHDINPIRIKFINQYIKPNSNIIDVGCGAGILTEELAKQQHTVTGIDINQDLINMAISHAKIYNLNIDYQQIEVHKLQPIKQFDAITCLELLEHVDNPEAIIQACAQLCKPNGLIYLSTLNRTLKSWLFGIVAAEHILKIVPQGTHHFEKFIKPSTLTTIAKQHNLQLLATKGIDYNPFNRKAKLTNNLDINYIIVLQKKL